MLFFQRVLKSSLIVLVAVIGVGCAQLSPQQIDFQPSIPTDGLIQGEGSTSLMVVDARVDKVIGIRGGAYAQTSTIVAKEPLEQVIESIALQVLEKTGFEVSTTFPDLDIAILLNELSYKTEDAKASIKRTTAVAQLSIQVKKGNVTFENGYRTSQYIETVGYPGDAKNEELLNNVFDAVLERMFSDETLETFILEE
jgi:uncharacterized lipoprotein